MSAVPPDGTDKPAVAFALGDVGFGAPSSSSAAPDATPASVARIVIVGPFSPAASHTTRSGGARTAVSVTRQSLDEAVARLAGTLVLEAPDPLDPSQPGIRLDLALTGMSGFRPDALVDGCSVLRDLLSAVAVARDASLAAPERQQRLAALLPRASWLARAMPSATGAGAGRAGAASTTLQVRAAPTALDDILSGFDLENAPTAISPAVAPTPTAAAQLLETFVAGTRTDAGRPDASPVLLRALGELLAFVLSSAELRRLEAAFRGAALLAARLPPGVRLDLASLDVDGDEDELTRVLSAALQEPADLVVLHETVRANAHSTARAATAASLGEQHQTPVVVDVDPAALGVTTVRELVTSGRHLRSAKTAGPVVLRALSGKDQTRWLMLAANRIVGRDRHGASSSRLPGVDVRDDAGPLFVPAAYGVAALALASLAEHGHVGGLSTARVEGVAVYTDADGAQLATEALPVDGALEDAGLAGFAVLASAAGRDVIALPHPRMAYRGAVNASGTSPAAGLTLADQMLVSLVARGLSEVAAALTRETPANVVKEVVLLALTAVLPSGEPRPALSVSCAEDRVHVTLRPRGFAGCLLGEIDLDARLAEAQT